MPRNLYSPRASDLTLPGIVPVKLGGTSAQNPARAAINLNAVPLSEKNQPLGVVGLNSAGTLEGSFIPATLDGPSIIYTGLSSIYTITNFNYLNTYNVSTTVGTVSRVGDTITYTPGAVAGTGNININGRVFEMTISNPAVIAPSIVSPVNGALNQSASVTLTSSAFAVGGSTDTHTASSWQVATDSAFTNIVASVTDSATDKLSWTATGLLVSTMYYARCRHKGTTLGNSVWSATSSFTTKVSFLPINEQAKLSNNDPAPDDRVGWSIALNSDGSICAVGAYRKNGALGAAYIFTRSGTTWTQQAKLTHSDPTASDYFGSSIALNSDGSTCAIGSYCKTDGANLFQGAAYIFTRSGITWTQQAKLLASNKAAYDYFGWSIALNSDGSICAIGAYNKTDTYTGQGAVYIFTRSGSIWSQQAILTASDKAADDLFGFRVSINSDGSICAIGAYGTAGTYQGAVYIFTRSGSTWTQQAKLLASDPTASDRFGSSVSLNNDGTICAIGADFKNVSYNGQGAVYIFTRSGSTWTQQAKLLASDPTASDRFGSSISLNSDGSICAIGAYNKTDTYTGQGAVYVFTRSGTMWTQQAKLLTSDPGTNDNFGSSIALNSDGSTCGVGAPQKTDTGGSNHGAAYIFA